MTGTTGVTLESTMGFGFSVFGWVHTQLLHMAYHIHRYVIDREGSHKHLPS